MRGDEYGPFDKETVAEERARLKREKVPQHLPTWSHALCQGPLALPSNAQQSLSIMLTRSSYCAPQEAAAASRGRQQHEGSKVQRWVWGSWSSTSQIRLGVGLLIMSPFPVLEGAEVAAAGGHRQKTRPVGNKAEESHSRLAISSHEHPQLMASHHFCASGGAEAAAAGGRRQGAQRAGGGRAVQRLGGAARGGGGG